MHLRRAVMVVQLDMGIAVQKPFQPRRYLQLLAGGDDMLQAVAEQLLEPPRLVE